MKSIMRMYAEEDKGVIFYETVITLKWQKHSYIECVPVPWEQFDVLPGYFKVLSTSHLFIVFDSSLFLIGIYHDERGRMVTA